MCAPTIEFFRYYYYYYYYYYYLLLLLLLLLSFFIAPPTRQQHIKTARARRAGQAQAPGAAHAASRAN